MKPMQPEVEISDASLIAAFAKGDANAMGTLVERYRHALFTWLVGMVGSREDAEDLFQEIWIRVIKNAERFKDISFRAWLWRIARNLVIDFRRRRKPEVSLDAISDKSDAPLVDRLESPEVGPAHQMETKDMATRVMQALETLPEVQREVFLMRTQSGMTFKEIAESLEIPLNTALGRMHDALKKLRVLLAKEVS